MAVRRALRCSRFCVRLFADCRIRFLADLMVGTTTPFEQEKRGFLGPDLRRNCTSQVPISQGTTPLTIALRYRNFLAQSDRGLTPNVTVRASVTNAAHGLRVQ